MIRLFAPILLTLLWSTSFAGFEKPLTCIAGAFREDGTFANYASLHNLIVLWQPVITDIRNTIRAAEIEEGKLPETITRYKYENKGTILVSKIHMDFISSSKKWRRGMPIDASLVIPFLKPVVLDDTGGKTEFVFEYEPLTESKSYKTVELSLNPDSLSGSIAFKTDGGFTSKSLQCWVPNW